MIGREELKKYRGIHNTYKFLKYSPGINPKRLLEIQKTAAVWSVLTNTMLPLERLYDVYDHVVRLNTSGTPGCLVECGVWSGGCVGLMAKADIISGGKRDYVLFDSFEGLPQPSELDSDISEEFISSNPGNKIRSADQDPKDLSAIGACVGETQAGVESFLVRTMGVPSDRLKFYVGWFQDTVSLAAAELEAIALLRIDGDFYESTKVCLEHLYDRVAPGGVVIIDDYGYFVGCKKAVDEFRESRGLNDITAPLEFVDSDCCHFTKPT